MADNSHRSSEFCSDGIIFRLSDLSPVNPNYSHFPVILSPVPCDLDVETVFNDERIWH